MTARFRMLHEAQNLHPTARYLKCTLHTASSVPSKHIPFDFTTRTIFLLKLSLMTTLLLEQAIDLVLIF
jgi:hypothetical protein